MQTATSNLLAEFNEPELTESTYLPVIGWNSDNRPVVWVKGARRVAVATDFNNFVGITTREASGEAENEVVAVLPGDGWMYRAKDGEDYAVAYFTVDKLGYSTAHAMLSDGNQKLDSLSDFDFLWHPFAPGMQPQDKAAV